MVKFTQIIQNEFHLITNWLKSHLIQFSMETRSFYIDSINFKNKIDNEGWVINKITDEFLLNMNG